MPINTLETATLFQTTLDQVAMHDLTTGWMEVNSRLVRYNGGSEVKIPKMVLQGLANYDRDSGYEQGAVTLQYETRSMTQDRGRKFHLDAMDTDETNFVLTASTIMGEFQRTKVIPEIDAYRISKLVTNAITANKDGMLKYSYTPAKASILEEILSGISKVRANGYKGELVIHISSEAKLALQLACADKLETVTFSVNGIDTEVPSIDRCPLIDTPSYAMVSAIQLNDGKTSGQKDGGFVKGSTGKVVNFIVCAREVPIAITKQDRPKIIDPSTNQTADAWMIAYRRFHDLWTLDNKIDGVYVNFKDAQA